MGNNKFDETSDNRAGQGTVKNLTEIEAEVYIEKAEKSEDNISENSEIAVAGDMSSVSQKIGKKQILLIVTVCLIFCVLAIFLFPENSDKKQFGDDEVLTESQTTTESLMDEFAREHGLIITKKGEKITVPLEKRTTTEATTSTTAVTTPTKPVELVGDFTGNVSKTITVTASTNKTVSVNYNPDLPKLTYFNTLSSAYGLKIEEVERYINTNSTDVLKFDPNKTTLPIYESQVYYHYFGGDDGMRYLGVKGDGVLGEYEMQEIVRDYAEKLGREIIKEGWFKYSYGDYIDTPPQDPIDRLYYGYGATLKGIKITLESSGELRIDITVFPFPDGMKVARTTDENFSEENQIRTYDYIMEKYGHLFPMEEPVYVYESTRSGGVKNGVYDAANTKYADSLVQFSTYAGLGLTTYLAPAPIKGNEYPIITLKEAKEKLFQGYHDSEIFREDNREFKEEDIYGYVCKYVDCDGYMLPYYIFYIKEFHNSNTGEDYYRGAGVPAIRDEYIELFNVNWRGQ